MNVGRCLFLILSIRQMVKSSENLAELLTGYVLSPYDLLLSGICRNRSFGSAALNISRIYPGDDTKMLTVYSENVTFLEAYYLCQYHGGWVLSGVWTWGIQYVKAAVTRQSRSYLSDGLWTGMFRHANNSNWLRANCKDVGDLNNNPSLVSNYVYETTQCIYLNTTTPADTIDNHFYAGPCDIRRPFVCAKRDAALQDNFLILHDKKIEYETPNTKSSNINYDACAKLLTDSEFFIYGAEYTEKTVLTGECSLYKEQTYNLPREVYLKDNEINRTVILKGPNEVIFDNVSYLNLVTAPSNPPCIPTTSSLTTMPLTGEQTSNSKPTTLSTDVPPICKCECSNTFSENVTKEELQKRIEELKEILKIDKKSVKSFQMTKTSASDERTSSVAIGSVGVIILVCLSLVIIVMDVPFYQSTIQNCINKNK